MHVNREFACFIDKVIASDSLAALDRTLAVAAKRMGYDFYALAHHVPSGAPPSGIVRLHNYPASWVEYFDSQGLGLSDPIRRASERTAVGFLWRSVPNLISLSERDRDILALAVEHGIGEGFTVPVSVPGDLRGSCSFAARTGRRLPVHSLMLAQLAGAFAFEAARRISVRANPQLPTKVVALTGRQRDCLLWAARGKGDWEISRILGISEETVAQHIRQACGRYGVQKRTSLMVHALFDGTLTLTEIVGR